MDVGDEPLPGRADVEAAQQVVRVHDDVHTGVGEQRDDLQGLRVLEPEEAHEHHGGVVEDVEEGERLLPQHHDCRVQELVQLAQVVDVGPEEDPAPGAGAQREAQQPPDDAGAAPALSHLHYRSNEASQEHDQGAQEQHQIVQGGDGAQRDRLEPSAGEKAQKPDEPQVGGHTQHQERNGSTPGDIFVPAEPHDGFMVGGPVPQPSATRLHSLPSAHVKCALSDHNLLACPASLPCPLPVLNASFLSSMNASRQID